MENGGCVHLDEFKKNDGLKTFKVLHGVFVICANAESRRTKVANANCHVCKRIGPYMHACLHCVFFGCHKHSREHGKKHNLSMDLLYGQIHCAPCGDYVYDPEIENIAHENKMKAGVCRKRLFDRTTWNPSKEELELFKYKFKSVFASPESTIGLRGLINLDSTCFMNCIVQVLMHTPLLRDYFLAERHKCKRVPKECLVCQLSMLFQKFYKGETVPLALHDMLHLIWTHSKQLAEEEMQDAHEFLVSTLNMLHQHCTASMSPAEKVATKGVSRCQCIIDQVFGGELQSLLVCQLCKGTSPTADPIWDISLELSSASSLTECLEQYTRAEHLGAVAKIACKSCKSYQEFTKQLTFKTLPIVVSFHLKRSSSTKTKISKKITFPETLDMTPFMTPSKTSSPIPTDNRYSLFAVVNHVGVSICTGHYTAFVRQQRNYWYQCSDCTVLPVNLATVLDSEA